MKEKTIEDERQDERRSRDPEKIKRDRDENR